MFPWDNPRTNPRQWIFEPHKYSHPMFNGEINPQLILEFEPSSIWPLQKFIGLAIYRRSFANR